MLRRFAVLAVGVLLTATVLAPAASAATPRTPFTGASVFLSEPDPGTARFVGDLMIVRNDVMVYWIESDNDRVTGTSTVTVNFNLNLATGDGQMWGKELLEPEAYPGSGYTCEWHGLWDNWAWVGKDVCHGFGDLKGWQVHYIPGPPVIEGVVIQPGG
jgi:hypothetical protein